MKCLCGADLDLPIRFQLLECLACGRVFREVDDLGWFGWYTAEVYELLDSYDNSKDWKYNNEDNGDDH